MRLNIYGNIPIITPRDPLVPMEAANKNYVDNTISAHASDESLHLSAAQNLLLDNLTVGYTEINQLAGITGKVQTLLDGKVSKAGDTLTGHLTLHADPLANLHAATKSYVDAGDSLKVSKAGDVMTGALTLSGDPSSNLHAAPKQYVDSAVSAHADNAELHLTPAQNTFMDSLTVSAAEVNQLSGVSSNVQTQLDAKLAKSGGTMTGTLTLAADPAGNLDAATKQYVDQADATKVAKAGDSMTGPLVLSGDPTANLHAAPKQYVDAGITGHANDSTLHITAAQNVFLDGITVTHTDVNQLSGITGNVQGLLDTKFDKAGGAITGDVTLAEGKTIFVSKVPASGTEVVNKSYVDSLIRGIEWKDPITDINLVNDSLSTPPASPVKDAVFVVGANATGDWLGREGYATYHDGTQWVFLQERAVQAGDRFGVRLTVDTEVSASLTAYQNQLVTVVSATPGAITYQADTLTPGATTLVFDPESPVFGVSYTYTDDLRWIPTNTSVNLTAGDGLRLDGNILNVVYDKGIESLGGVLNVAIDPNTGLHFDGTGNLALRRDGTSLTASAAGVKVSDAVMADIDDRVSRSGSTSVTGTITIASTGALKSDATPTATNDVVTKGYVDSVDTALQGQLTTLQGTVATLNADPVTKTYVDQADATKVAKAGDTMTGPLVLSGDPTGNLHAAPKQYVDTNLSAHATDASLHLTSTQNTFLDGLTITHTEANYLEGVSSKVQPQLDSKVNKAGDVMSGHLELFADPTIDAHAANKSYVDSRDALKVNKAGDTMTGPLVLPGNPAAALEATPKQYVDTNLSSHATDNSLHLTPAQNTFLDGITITHTEANQLSGVTSNVQNQLDAKLNLTGGTLTGPLTLSGDPAANLHAAPKQYVDSRDALKVDKAGDVMSGHLTLHADPIDLMHASNKQYVDTSVATLKTYVNDQDATKVNKSGSTMTGHLTLHADPVDDLHAAPKQYVDGVDAARKTYVDGADAALQSQITSLQSTVNTLNADPVTKNYVDAADAQKVNKAGDTLTGYLTLHADPQQSMHPATKQYVDAVAQGLVTKPSVRYATTEALNATYHNGTFGVNSTLTGVANGALTVDGGTVVVGDRILVKDQVNKAHNGDYVVQQVGDALTPFIVKRIETIDESDEVPGSYFYVYDGATLKGTGWVFTVDNPITYTIGVDDISVNQFSGQGSLIAGNGLTINGNTIDVNTANPTRIVVNADNIDLAVTGVTPGQYTKISVDGYGRVMTGTNPNTLTGYGITDGQPLNANLTSLSLVETAGLLVRDNTNTVVTKAVTTTGVGLSVTNGSGANSGAIEVHSNATDQPTADTLVSRDAAGNFSANVITANLTGNATTATTLATARNFSITGDVTATAVSFNGSAPVALNATLVDSGVTAGTYTKVLVDAKGRVTAGTVPSSVADLGITDVYDKLTVDEKLAAMEAKFNELYLYVLSRI